MNFSVNNLDPEYVLFDKKTKQYKVVYNLFECRDDWKHAVGGTFTRRFPGSRYEIDNQYVYCFVKAESVK